MLGDNIHEFINLADGSGASWSSPDRQAHRMERAMANMEFGGFGGAATSHPEFACHLPQGTVSTTHRRRATASWRPRHVRAQVEMHRSS